MNFNSDKLLKECKFITSRSSGVGGQHVNKVETRVTINFDLIHSEVFSEEQKTLIREKLKIDKKGIISLSSQKYKSQLKNKEDVKLKLIALLKKSLVVKKERIKTKVSKEAKQKRLKDKKIISELKKSRTKPKITLDH